MKRGPLVSAPFARLIGPIGPTGATPSNCRDVLLGCWYRPGLERGSGHLGESRGYGNNPADRDNRQPSPKDPRWGPWMQFTD